ncbi:cysteine-rich repeat secretory protein 38-like [Nymphaea colorata]|uniref:Gnk2-homologous domain-containing protein n=1 Tax=Nymphaea colorata TaxID=210225 RepID=A0A5K0W1A9_9MAGN|nr:cysteine-rich repeat secretory protein 38-like [Nymphaea colorata]
MSSPKLVYLALALTVALSLQPTSYGAEPLLHRCAGSSNYTSTSFNLQRVLLSLNIKTAATGFSMSSAGKNSDRVSGLSLCRGAVSGSDCRTCVKDASIAIQQRCPNQKQGIIWYDNCMLRYSDLQFFGKIDSENRFFICNTQNVSNPEVFNKREGELMSALSRGASTSPLYYAVGVIESGEGSNIYGLAECTRDLSSADCKTCLDNAIASLPSFCGGKKGGRSVSGSCSLRYEIYPFFKQ